MTIRIWQSFSINTEYYKGSKALSNGSPALKLLSSFGLAKHGAVALPAEAHPLLDLPGHGYLCPVSGEAEVLAQDPNAARIVLELESAAAETTKRIGGAP